MNGEPELAPVPEHPRRLVYLGSPAAAVPPLRALVAAGADVALVVSATDKRRGRGGMTTPTPVKAAALELGLPISERVADALDVDADLGVVVAYGRLVKAPVLARLPMVNLHFSLLPRWRGAAPVERAVLAGDEETGVCLMQLEVGLDTGPVYALERTAIDPDETVEVLRARLVDLGTRLLVDQLGRGFSDPVPQGGEPTYAAKLEPADLELRVEDPAVTLHRIVRVGRAWTTFRERRLLVRSARVVADPGGEPGSLHGTVVATGDGGLELVEVQPEGRGPMAAAAWRNGTQPTRGERLGA